MYFRRGTEQYSTTNYSESSNLFHYETPPQPKTQLRKAALIPSSAEG